MQTHILGQSYVARSLNAAADRMINLYPETIPGEGQTSAYLNRAPGLRKIMNVGAGPIRGLWQYGGKGYVVSGQEVYQLDSSWNATLIGAVSGAGPVSIADNGIQMFIACNGPSYIFNNKTNEFVQITDPDFTGAVTVMYLDGYFVYNEPNSQTIWATTLLDGTSIDPLAFASAEANPDNVVTIMADHGELWVFGTNSIEVWYDAGTIPFPFARIQGAYTELGCAAPYSVAKADNTIFWLGSDARGRGIVFRAEGYRGVRVSTHAIEYAIQSYGNISNAVGYTYQQDGHSFYVLIFPSASKTWVYDAATQLWHERAAWDQFHGVFYRHRSNCQMSFNNEIVVGDYENGNVYAFDLNVYDDNGALQKWLRSWRALPPNSNNLKRTAHHTLQLITESGIGLQQYPEDAGGAYILTQDGKRIIITGGSPNPIVTTAHLSGAGYNPEIMLRWSDDGGHTWSNEHWRTMGKYGETWYRTIWRRLGMAVKLRDRVYEISGTDPVKIAIMGAELVMSQTDA
jgi:hypothetical protein